MTAAERRQLIAQPGMAFVSFPGMFKCILDRVLSLQSLTSGPPRFRREIILDLRNRGGSRSRDGDVISDRMFLGMFDPANTSGVVWGLRFVVPGIIVVIVKVKDLCIWGKTRKEEISNEKKDSRCQQIALSHEEHYESSIIKKESV